MAKFCSTKFNMLKVFITILYCFIKSYQNKLPICQPNDFHYEFTECDSYGGRWRVSVPTPGTCVGGEPKPPERGKDCMFSCPPGYFLDLQSDQECHPCSAGTYSLGGGIRYDQWETFPQGFKAISEKLEDHEDEVSEFLKYNCSKSIWKASGSYISSLPNLCVASLYYTVKLVKSGSLTFSYQYSNADTFFNFIVINDRCENVPGTSSHRTRWLEITEQGEWRDERVALKTGDNTIIWRAAGLADLTSISQAVLIRQIEVEGIAYTSECSPCPAGHSSDNGSRDCMPCGKDYFAPKPGSPTCKPCPANQYSARGSNQCDDRPACATTDYSANFGPCDLSTMKRTVTYDWIRPKICTDQSIYLPPSRSADCRPCPAGQFYEKKPLNGTSGGSSFPRSGAECTFCPSGTFSDGTFINDCKKCPAGTFANYGFFYTQWYTMPQHLTSYCYTLMSNCAPFEGWSADGDSLCTRSFRRNSSDPVTTFDILALDQLTSVRPPYGTIEFEFQLECRSQCLFFFVKTNGKKQTQVIKKWSGQPGSPKISWAYTIEAATLKSDVDSGNRDFFKTPPSLPSFRWIFQKTHNLADEAKIYSVNMTNLVLLGADGKEDRGGAISCLPCMFLDPDPQPSSTNGEAGVELDCVPCPVGSYPSTLANISSSNNSSPATNLSCLKCAANTKLDVMSVLEGRRASDPLRKWVALSPCIPCGHGTISDHNGLECYNDCSYGHENGSTFYDFRPLSGIQAVTSEPLFTAGGTPYYYAFNFSLCRSPGDARGKATCSNNVSDASIHSLNASNPLFEDRDRVVSWVCRSTIIPSLVSYSSSSPKKNSQLFRSVQPVSLGEELVAVGTVDAVPLLAQHLKTNLNHSAHHEGIHFMYRSPSPTLACPSGRSTVVTLICDTSSLIKAETGHLIQSPGPSQHGNAYPYDTGTVQVPVGCKLGTCDGCNFQFLWKTPYACPVCGAKDIKIMKGECVKGSQITYYYPAQYCIPALSNNHSFPYTRTVPCSPVPPHIQLIIFISAVAGILLCLAMFFMWKRTKKLEYKYMALVQQTYDGNGPKGPGGDINKNEAQFLGVDSCAIVEGEDEDDCIDQNGRQKVVGWLSGKTKNGETRTESLLRKLKRTFAQSSGGSVNKGFNSGAAFENITLEASVPLTQSYRSTEDRGPDGDKNESLLPSLQVTNNGTRFLTPNSTSNQASA